MRIGRLLVATDFSAAGNRAVQAAVEIAGREKASLRIVHVAPPRRWMGGLWGAKDSLIDAACRQAGAALQRLADTRATPRELEVSTGLLSGVASRTIARAVTEFRTDLLVIGARGEQETATHRPGLGGTAAKLLEKTIVPLLLVRNERAAAPETVIAAVELSPPSASVVDWARTFAAHGKVHAFHAHEMPFAARLEAYGLGRDTIDVYSEDERGRRDRELAALLDAYGLADAQRIIERGDAATLLLGHVDRLDADLVVLGKHTPRPRRERATTFGSVCRYVSWATRANVLVVPR